jgi:5-methylcytosine-specific restriction enzyme subunit McrC
VLAPRSLVLDELDHDGAELELTDEQARLLGATSLVEVRQASAGRVRLLPCGQVGVVRIGELQVEVKPKEGVGLAHLIFMLGYARDPGFRDSSVWAEADDALWPALGWSLAKAVEGVLALGVLQGYRTRDEALGTIRGRIRFGDQIASRPGMLLPVEVTHDDYTVDTTENRILLAALERMLGVPRLDPDVRRRLRHLTGRLEGVTRLPRGSAVPGWSPSRLNARYHGALRLAEVILRHASTKATRRSDGSYVEMASFVVTMWDVFEAFVTTALREALRHTPGSTHEQLPVLLAGPGDWTSGLIPMKVDLVHVDEMGRPQIVFDAKYKIAGPDGQYANADIYQMLAYCTALRVPRAWLVYAAGKGQGQSTFQIKNSEVEVVQVPLDLSQPPQETLATIAAVARQASARSDLTTICTS